MMSEDFLRSMVARIVANCEPEQILLFGSQVTNSASDASDVDLLIIKSTPLPMWRRGRNIQALLVNSRVKFDLLFYTQEELEAERAHPHSFISSILKSARVVYSQSNAVRKIGE